MELDIVKALILRFENRVKNVIRSLFEGIDLLSFEIDITHWESFSDDVTMEDCDFNTMDIIPSQLSLRKIFIEDNRINPEFVELHIRKLGSKPYVINNYKDFLSSDYIISIVNCDYRNIEVFSKDSSILEVIKNNFMKLNVGNKRVKEIDYVPNAALISAWAFGNGIEY